MEAWVHYGASRSRGVIVSFPLRRASDDVTRRHLPMEQVQKTITTKLKSIYMYVMIFRNSTYPEYRTLSRFLDDKNLGLATVLCRYCVEEWTRWRDVTTGIKGPVCSLGYMKIHRR